MIKQKNRCMNFFKGICCIAVILMHCSFPNKIGNFITYPLKIAVPFFFMISGYFSYKNDSKRIFLKALHILKLTLISEFIYGVYYYFFERDNLLYNDFFQILKKIFCGTFFNGTLWFLYALFWSYICMMFFIRCKNKKIVYITDILVLILHVIVRVNIKKYEWYSADIFRNFVLYGFPFVNLGYFINEYKDKILNYMTNKKCILLAICGELALIIEYLISRESIDFYIGTIITTFSIFVFAVNNPNLYINSKIEFIGEKLSMYIYILHILGMNVVVLLANNLKINENFIFKWTKPIFSIICTIIISYIIYYIVNMKNKIGENYGKK